MLINVTQEHIDNGQKRDHLFCPIALALKEANFSEPQITEYVAYWNSGAKQKIVAADLPRSACRFIRAFDNERPVKPFNFRLPT